ncbi:MAG: hypothetical protein WC624_06305 [Candidatus Margulisiibacteriota bacterium]
MGSILKALAVSVVAISSMQACKSTTHKNAPICYRDSVPAGLPFDYNLWAGERACTDRSCAPAMPPILKTKEEIDTFEKRIPEIKTVELPNDEKELEAFLYSAEKTGLVTWVSPDNSEIYRAVQSEINSSAPDQDVHIFFGETHYIKDQLALFNGIVKNTNGISALALEYYRFGPSGSDSQFKLDKDLISPSAELGFNLIPDSPKVQNEEIEERTSTFKLGRDKCLNVIFSGPRADDAKKIKESIGKYYQVEARDIFAVKAVRQRLDPKVKNVVVWERGAGHVHIPELINDLDPKAKVVTFIINGGAYIRGLAFDRALRNMGWLERSFVLKVNGYYILHIPTNGIEMDLIPTESNAAVREIYPK